MGILMKHYPEECPSCHSRRTVRGLCLGEINSQGSSTHFRPRNIGFRFVDTRVRLQRDQRLIACLDCGLLWSRLYSKNLAKIFAKTKKAQDINITEVVRTMVDTKICPGCRNQGVAEGVLSGRLDYAKPVFRPRGLRFFVFAGRDVIVENKGRFMACPDCDLVWSEVNAQTLSEIILKKGNKKAKQLLTLNKIK